MRRNYYCLLLCVLLVSACAKDLVKPQAEADPVDMSGHWELDYGLSDSLQARYSAMLRELREQASRAPSSNERARGGVVVSGGSSQESLIGLARMAELITESQLLEVQQSRVSIRVKRDGNFSLSCDYGPGAVQRNDYGVGDERCFWDGRQLVFQIRLPEGLDIVHRLSVSESGEILAILSSLYSSRVSSPFTLRRIYRRYTPGSQGYRCRETLTRGRVCSTESE